MLMLLYAPFPAVGCLPMVVYQFLQKSNFVEVSGRKSFRAFLRNTLTVENVTGLIVCLIIALFYMSNIATGSVGTIQINKDSIMEFALYFATEYLVYLVFILLFKKADALYWVLMGSMVVFSFITLGNNYDFGWRTCIPAAFYTMLLIMKILTDPASGQKGKRLKFALIVILALGSVTPAMEMLRTVEHTASYVTGASSEPLKSSALDTVFDQENNKCYDNFIGTTDSIFAKYLMRH